MLRSTLIRQALLPALSHSHSAALRLPSHRFASTSTVPLPSALPSSTSSTSSTSSAQPKTTDAGDVLGGEGKHPQDTMPKLKEDFKTGELDLSTPYNGAWTMHTPVYTEAQLEAVRVVVRQPTTTSDVVSAKMVKLLRAGFDLVSMYKHRPLPEGHEKMSLDELRKHGCFMTPNQWLTRILFLESTAALPGMVAGAIRHLQSLRLMRRDGGWIHTLLSEAENERMHLMTFMQLRNPGFFFRALVLVSQGVFYNAFFLVYLCSPRIAHRFVACLEEEAVYTYTRCIDEIEGGRLPEWADAPAPDIARDYWRLKEDANLLDVIKAVRADEATHRFVNHTLANLDSKKDFSPFSLAEPSADVRGAKPGFERDEAARFAAQARRSTLDQRKDL